MTYMTYIAGCPPIASLPITIVKWLVTWFEKSVETVDPQRLMGTSSKGPEKKTMALAPFISPGASSRHKSESTSHRLEQCLGQICCLITDNQVNQDLWFKLCLSFHVVINQLPVYKFILLTKDLQRAMTNSRYHMAIASGWWFEPL